MTTPAFGVIPEHACRMCGNTGWITCIDTDGESGYEIPCPEGCPVPELPPVQHDLEAPF